jgi:hypothetical protein
MARESAAARAANELLASQIMEMSASGGTLPKIARALKITEAKAKKLFQREMQRVLTSHADIREAVYAQELENTRLLRAAIMPGALKGIPRAVEVALAVGKEYRSQLGMTEALKVEVSAQKVEETMDKLVDIVDGADVAKLEPLRRYTEIPSQEVDLRFNPAAGE